MTQSPETQPDEKAVQSGNAIASLILGLVGFLLWTTIPILGLGAALIALALGIYSLAKKQGNKISAVVGVVLGGIGLLVSLIALSVSAVVGSIDSTEREPYALTSENSEMDVEPKDPGLGEQATDGSFTFTVNSMECGITTVGNEYLNTTAQGQFCKMNLTVTNTGNSPEYMFAANQKAFDEAGREFAQDSTPGLYEEGDPQVWMTEINPGNTVTGNIYFDIPVDAVLNRVELRENAFSRGVSVSLK